MGVLHPFLFCNFARVMLSFSDDRLELRHDLATMQPITKERSVLMSDFIFYNFTRVMLSFLTQVGACLELMGEVRPLVGQAFFVSFASIVMLSFLFTHFFVGRT